MRPRRRLPRPSRPAACSAPKRDLMACAMMLIANYGGRVPDTMEELLKLPGVGRKTANLILGIFRQTGHCVRYALHPFVQSAGLRQEREGPGQGGERPEKLLGPGGVVRFLPPAGAVRPRALHRPQSQVRGLSARCGVPVVSLLRNNIEKSRTLRKTQKNLLDKFSPWEYTDFRKAKPQNKSE